MSGALRTVALLPLLVGCGLGGMGGELALDSFPQSGLGPYRLLAAAELPGGEAPFILSLPGIDLDEPSALVEGESIDLFVTARRAGEPSTIALARLPRLAAGAMEVSEVVRAEAAWEGGAVRAPALVADVPGLPGRSMLYQGADGSVGLLRESGGAWRRVRAERPLASAAELGPPLQRASPLVSDERLYLYYLASGATLLRAEVDLSSYTLRATSQPLLAASDFSVPTSSTDKVPAERLSGLFVRRVMTPFGRARYDLFVIAHAGERQALLAAASYDGLRFLVLPEPILRRPPGVPSAPHVLTYRGRALLLLGLTSVRTGIAAGVIP